jgi:hypothetical protein
MVGNPVVKALATAQQEAWNQNEAAIERAVSQILHPVLPLAQAGEGEVSPAISAFACWCEMMNVRSCPTRPAVLACFIVKMSATIPAAELLRAVTDIADWNLSFGLANPAATPTVLAALNEIVTVEPPRSWPTEQKMRFRALPHDLQSYIAEREKDRDLVVRRAQNAAADARRKLTIATTGATTETTADTTSTEMA